MVTGKSASAPYSWEELLSFDRLKRAIANRVLTRVEQLSEKEFPLSPDQVDALLAEEWQCAKEAVRSSPAAQEAFRKYLEHTISERIDKLIQSDKAELERMGVVEKGL